MQKLKLQALLLSLLLTTTACLEHEVDTNSPRQDDEPSIDGLADHQEDLDHIVEPVLTVEVGDHLASRSLFHNGIAHFESSQPFQQVSWMMDAEHVEGLEFSALQESGEWSDWQPVQITWSEEIFHNALILLDSPATELKLRGGDAILWAEIEFYDRHLANLELINADGHLPAADLEADIAEDEDIRSISAAVAPSSLVISRAQWGARQPNKICGSVYRPYRIAIHHTYRPAGDGGNPAARMRQMQNYHMDSQGWCDIGYHFVISQSGKIYQGRSRSDRPGAHVGNQNSGNVGISFIADFTVQTPTNTQLNAGASIMRWVSNRYGITLNRNTVKGHREHAGQSTSCPGNLMVNRLNDLIARAKSSGGSTPAPDPKPEPPPPPPPGGCTPSADSNASSAFFKDFRPTATGYDEAILLYDADITKGCNASPRMFCPNCPLTRGHMATFLARASKLKTSNPPATPTFSDVPKAHPHYKYVEAIAAAGITNGCGSGKFCPSQEITRAQAASMIKRALKWDDETPKTGSSFTDVNRNHGHFAAIETLKNRCVTGGCGGDKFCPADKLTRGQAAAMIARAYNLEDNNPCANPGGCTPIAAYGTENSQFADFPIDQFGYEESLLLYEANITQGCTQTPSLMFCPKCSTSRLDMVRFLVRALGLDTSNPPATATFSDVPVGSPGFAAVEAAAQAGITRGCGGDKFCPQALVNRGQSASMIANALNWAPKDPNNTSFSDVPTDHGHFNGIQAIADRCVTSGCSAGKYCPTGNVSRAHAAVLIARAFNLNNINPCADDPDEVIVDAPITPPDTDLEPHEDDDPAPAPDDVCSEVDPAFVPLECTAEGDMGIDDEDIDPDAFPDDFDDLDDFDGADPADGSDDTPGGGNGPGEVPQSGDPSTNVATQSGCSTTNNSTPPLTLTILLVGVALLRRQRRRA